LNIKSPTVLILFQIKRMITNPNLKRSRDFSTSNSTNEFDNISEDNESNSDTDYHISETEFDDISTDEFIS
jgi:hypothetical protein